MDARSGVQRLPLAPCPAALKPCKYVQPHLRGIGSADVVFFRRSSRMRRGLTMLLSSCRKRWRCSSHQRRPCRPMSRLHSNLKSPITSCTPHTKLIYNVLLILYRELERIRASTSKWTKAEKNLPRRLLDARRVATELEGVMKEIQQANLLFIVRSFYKRDGIAPLISTLDGDHYEDGDAGREHPAGCWICEAEHDGCQGELSSMTCTSLIAHDDDGRINVRTTDFRLSCWLTYSS
jgi:hypothetical protein